jgi:hypothetical protein
MSQTADRDDHRVGIVALDGLLQFLGRELYNLAEEPGWRWFST